MREERYHIALDKYDKNIVINTASLSCKSVELTQMPYSLGSYKSILCLTYNTYC